MGKYVIDINEKSNRGKALKTFLEQNPELKMMDIEQFGALEDNALAREIRKDKKTKLLSYEDGKNEFRKLRRRLNK